MTMSFKKKKSSDQKHAESLTAELQDNRQIDNKPQRSIEHRSSIDF
uniref:Uncharacterized protein n=1 Tax=Rhizophora mucronata TaxID=61149 RepID=A0A2P2N553_RHIMU